MTSPTGPCRLCGVEVEGPVGFRMRALLLAALLLASLAAIPPTEAAVDPCNTQVAGGTDTGVYTRDCQVIVSEKTYDCIWGGHWTEKTYGPITVRTYSCNPPGE